MNLKQLSYFKAVVEQGGFSAAARHLHIAQPAISIAIRKLESELELTLLQRSERKITATTEGEVLLQHANRLLEQASIANLEMNELKGLTKGEVRIGIPSMLGSYYFPPFLMGFKHRYPELRLSVFEQGTRRLQEMIRSGELDLGVVVADAPPADLETRFLTREEMVACVPKEHPFANKTSITMDEFFSQELVVFKPGYFLREFIDRFSQQRGEAPTIAFETNLIPLTKAIVRQGFGITTFLRMVVEQDSQQDLVAVPFSEPVHLDLSLAWKKEGYLSRADRAFVEYILEHVSRE
ncbi:MAG: LysR substrate-binding domain-containing protein [Candidatus Thiodiazotropha lotti]|uniref:LysR family transcriptional regulator n=1 Tax=Candidatus Thiodiazotropha endoloripes TaxID=1818881 RepID=A0A1E2UUC1_9GAMM|nr:LysR substrate-binding domain-containing protein [Candidatus Thiodiazotropha endoloripes]MCG7899815.1 LysR substrate-binding domain-containing protein [Candidatus Thiodiazotropha weberae]MCG7993762.1 LysR substrate-binding domain-containing protein [Candidatus Thiodiazotropha lotti]MCG7904585.1 LysR substrate-binding domain-containing protein [Candidatus Thiodiazotropha weberae]MCG7915403.1 LysR substrate-binding domain-containing protein [Candidatus Thiodiazotropha weberae]MCG8001689.1 Lys